jgi:hypothetical protein
MPTEPESAKSPSSPRYRYPNALSRWFTVITTQSPKRASSSPSEPGELLDPP